MELPKKSQRLIAKYVFIGVVIFACVAVLSALIDAAGGTDLPQRLLR